MRLIEILAISIVLGTDAFSMAIGIGAKKVNLQDNIRISTVIGAFHVFMPLLGFYLGRMLGAFYDDLAIYFGGFVLILLGLHMFYEYFRPRGHKLFDLDELRGKSLFLLGFGVSMDAMSVGLSLGALGTNLGLAVLIIGLTALVMTATGLSIGNEIGKLVGRHGKLVGAIVLVALGIRVFFEA